MWTKPHETIWNLMKPYETHNLVIQTSYTTWSKWRLTVNREAGWRSHLLRSTSTAGRDRPLTVLHALEFDLHPRNWTLIPKKVFWNRYQKWCFWGYLYLSSIYIHMCHMCILNFRGRLYKLEWPFLCTLDFPWNKGRSGDSLTTVTFLEWRQCDVCPGRWWNSSCAFPVAWQSL